MRNSDRKSLRGFTLLEVLVALAVFAIASTALVKNATQTVKQTNQLETKTIAFWLAENKLNEIRAAPRAPDSYLSPGKNREDAQMANREWDIETEVEATENDDVRRVTVSVYLASDVDASLVSLTGFVGRF